MYCVWGASEVVAAPAASVASSDADRMEDVAGHAVSDAVSRNHTEVPVALSVAPGFPHRLLRSACATPPAWAIDLGGHVQVAQAFA